MLSPVLNWAHSVQPQFDTFIVVISDVCSQRKAPTEWVSILQDEVLATALLDRLLYRCDVVKLSGTSYRMENRSGFLGKPAEKKEDRK